MNQNLGKMITEQLRNPNELDISLRMEFGPFETVHKWKRMSECYEFVGARYVTVNLKYLFQVEQERE